MADVILFNGFLIGSVILAIALGGMPERIGATILTFDIISDLSTFASSGGWEFSTFSNRRLFFDLLELSAMLLLALRANRIWPLFLTSAQLVIVAGSVAVFLQKNGSQIAYWAVTQIPLVVEFGVLTLGCIAHCKREKALGPYRDWR